MAESDSPPDVSDAVNDTSGSPYRSRRRTPGRNNNKKNTHRHKTDATFKGPLVGYETYVYAFNTITVKLSEYISISVPNAEEFMNATNHDD